MAPSDAGASHATERTPMMPPTHAPSSHPARRAGRGRGRPTHRGGANTSLLALAAAVCSLAAMFVVVTKIDERGAARTAAAAYAARVGALSAERVAESPHAVMYDPFGGPPGSPDRVELAWQTPPDPVGLLFVAHGCGHAATDFFPRSDRCPTCAGLPEESRLVAKALKRRLAVAAVSSRGGCWRPSLDAPRVRAALERVRERAANGALAAAPTYAFGASSGGAFVGALPFATPVDGVVSQIASVRLPARLTTRAALGEELRAFGGRGEYPPVVFSHMSRDAATARSVDASRAYLESVGAPVRVTELAPQPVDDAFFHRKLTRFAAATSGGDSEAAAALGVPTLEPAVRLAESARMAAALRDAGLLDSEGYLREDPRRSEWREALRRHAARIGDSMVPDESPIAEVLNVAYAAHELSADGFDEDMKWLEDRRKDAVAERKKRAAEGENERAREAKPTIPERPTE